MLAMQELTQVPFRCVDEINQVAYLSHEALVVDSPKITVFNRAWIP